MISPQLTEDVRVDSGSAMDEEPRYSTEPKLSRGEADALYQRMKMAQKHYERNFKPIYEESDRMWRGKHWPDSVAREDEHHLVINYTRHAVKTQVASIAFTAGEVSLRPMTPDGEQNAETSKRMVDYQLRESNTFRTTKRALRESIIYGLGVVMTGWEFQVENRPPMEGRMRVEGEELTPEQQAEAIASGEEPEVVPEATVLKDGCYVRRIDPRDFRVPPESDWVLDDAPWCGYVEIVDLASVKANPHYRNTKGLKGSTRNLEGYLGDDIRKMKQEEMPSDVKRVMLTHYYEKRRRLHVVFCDEHQKPLMVEKWYWEHERYPFRCLFGTVTEADFYPDQSPVQEWRHQQQEINATRTQLMNVRAQMVPKWLTRKGTLTARDRIDFRNTITGTVLETNDPNPQTAMAVLPLPQLTPDFYQNASQAMQDFSTLSTLSAYEVGDAPTKRMTQQEVSSIQGAGSAIKEEARQQYEKLCAGIAEDFLDLAQQFWQKTVRMPIYSQADVLEGWTQPITQEDIQGDYQFIVNVGSTEVKNQAGRVEELAYMLQAMGPLIQMGVINPKPLVKQMLQSMPDIRDVDAILSPPAPPQPEAGAGPPPPGMEPMEGGQPPTGGMNIPPELLAQLQGGGGGF
jgi:hypothetical protein